jgi:hypothetical protein
VRFKIRDAFAVPLSRTARAMVAVNICLVAVLAAEILDGIGAAPETDPIAVPMAPVPSTVPHTVSSSTVSESESLQTVAATIVSRPLFSPDRRPAPPKVDLAAATTVVEPPVRLVGTIVSDHVRIAILEMAGKQEARAVGDSVGTSRIVGIDPALIRIQSGDGHISDVDLSWGTKIEPTPRPARPKMPRVARFSRE